MKRKIKILLSLCIVLSFLLSITTVNAESVETNLPDALNSQLEIQKLQQISFYQSKLNSKLSSTNEEQNNKIILDPNRPLVLKFDDGSTITYTVKHEKTGVSALNSWSKRSVIEKSYTWMTGYARIELSVADFTYYDTQYGRGFIKSSDPNDIWQDVVDTGFATVQRISAVGKHHVYSNGQRQSIRAQAKGDITYNIAGIAKQQTYTFQAELDPDTHQMSLISTY
ncbi:hypothetical protein ACFQZE_24275 [Paenibacillus sp. GCM10027627]|uniref:hypothetical protein n=1 Tax=unclassified Paenibacillus TaxID=185978 RepID=UPI0036276045